jgi:hypothetical protein
MKKQRRSSARYVVCVRNDGYPEALELRKLYRVVADAQAAKVAHIRVIDESGEDYLYPVEFFVPVELSKPARDALSAA